MTNEHTQRLPKVTGWREIVIDKQSTRDTYEGEVPEEIMAFAESVIGNGQARVAVSCDMGLKDFGNGSGAGVTISVSCNQDDQTIANVTRTLGQYTRFYVQEQLKAADEEFQKVYYQKHPEKAPQVTSGSPQWTPPPSFKP